MYIVTVLPLLIYVVAAADTSFYLNPNVFQCRDSQSICGTGTIGFIIRENNNLFRCVSTSHAILTIPTIFETIEFVVSSLAIEGAITEIMADYYPVQTYEMLTSEGCRICMKGSQFLGNECKGDHLKLIDENKRTSHLNGNEEIYVHRIGLIINNQPVCKKIIQTNNESFPYWWLPHIHTLEVNQASYNIKPLNECLNLTSTSTSTTPVPAPAIAGYYYDPSKYKCGMSCTEPKGYIVKTADAPWTCITERGDQQDTPYEFTTQNDQAIIRHLMFTERPTEQYIMSYNDTKIRCISCMRGKTHLFENCLSSAIVWHAKQGYYRIVNTITKECIPDLEVYKVIIDRNAVINVPRDSESLLLQACPVAKSLANIVITSSHNVFFLSLLLLLLLKE